MMGDLLDMFPARFKGKLGVYEGGKEETYIPSWRMCW